MKKCMMFLFLGLLVVAVQAAGFVPGQKWLLKVVPEKGNRLHEFVALCEFDSDGGILLFQDGQAYDGGAYELENQGDIYVLKIQIRNRGLLYGLEIEGVSIAGESIVTGNGQIQIQKNGGMWPGGNVRFTLTPMPGEIEVSNEQ